MGPAKQDGTREIRRMNSCYRLLFIVLAACALSVSLGGCASDSNGAITTSSSGGLTPGDTAATTGTIGTPRSATGTGSSMGPNGLGGGRGSF